MLTFDKYFKINETLNLTDIEQTDFIYDLHSADEDYTDVLVKYFNINKTYIEIEDAKKHLFKLNDIEGDILNNNRVKFSAIVFKDYDVNVIKNNMVKYCLNKYYEKVSQTIDILGIQVNPVNFINKTELKYTFENNITVEEVIKTISLLYSYNYGGVLDGYYIWSKK
jgi:hypothetical protein